MLLAVSPYLQSTFRHANPTSQLEVNLPRATGVRAARDFLKYVYQGVLHVGPDTVHALRRIATMLQMEKLLGYCDDYLTLLNTSAASSMAHSSIMPHATAQVREYHKALIMLFMQCLVFVFSICVCACVCVYDCIHVSFEFCYRILKIIILLFLYLLTFVINDFDLGPIRKFYNC